MSRGEVFFFFGTEGKQRGLVWGIKRRNLGQDVGYIFHHCLGFRGGRGGGNHVSVSRKSGDLKKGTKKSKGPISLEFPLLSFHLSSALCCYLLYFSLNIYSLGPKYS